MKAANNIQEAGATSKHLADMSWYDLALLQQIGITAE